MSQENPIVLYVGDTETEQWLAASLEPYGGYVYREDELLRILGLHVTYMPDLVVLDARATPELARKVFSHLLTVDAEPILVLDDCVDDYPDGIRVLTTSDKNDVLAQIGDLTGILFSLGEGAYYD